MKTFIKILFIAGIAGGFLSCSKNTVPPNSTVAALSFVNATVGASPVVVRVGNPNTIYSTLAAANKLSYGSSNLFSPTAGINSFSFVQTTDTTHTLFTANLNLQNASIYSFYLAGTVSQPDTVFIHEHLPVYAHADTVAGIRFINLSQNANAISVDIKGQANGSEVQSLAYKARTGFKVYKADHTVASYVFEYRDATTGNLLATYTLSGVNTNSATVVNNVQFHNMTIALIGGGAAATSAILIPNY